MLIEIFKTLDAIGRLNRGFAEEKRKNKQLIDKMSDLERENLELKLEQSKQDGRIKSLEEVMDRQRKSIKVLADADRDLDAWKDMMYQTLTAISDLDEGLIFKLTGRKKSDNKGPL